MSTMSELVSIIEKVITSLMRYDMDSYAQEAQTFVDNMVATLPAIIECYSKPEMSDVKEDALYWPGQLERIINALESHDRFEAIDVLLNETTPNLIELIDMLKERGLS